MGFTETLQKAGESLKYHFKTKITPRDYPKMTDKCEKYWDVPSKVKNGETIYFLRDEKNPNKGKWLRGHNYKILLFKTQMSALRKRIAEIQREIEEKKSELNKKLSIVTKSNTEHAKLSTKISALEKRYQFVIQRTAEDYPLPKALRVKIENLKAELNRMPSSVSTDDVKTRFEGEISNLESKKLANLKSQLEDNEYWLWKTQTDRERGLDDDADKRAKK